MTEARIGPYRILSSLGTGSTAEVYMAEVLEPVADLEAGTLVALKVLHPELSAKPRVVRRFLREIDIGKTLQHENLVRTLGAGSVLRGSVEQHYLVMELMRGKTLRELLNEEGRQPESLCRHIGAEVAKGLATVHAAKLVHRDVRPENIFITEDQQVKLMDLGVALLRDRKVSTSGSGGFVGCVLYAAPEQFRGSRELDGRADLYALGLTLYELATGSHPFPAGSIPEVMHLQTAGELRRAGIVNPQLSPFLDELTLTLLAKDRGERFADAATLAETLRQGEESAWWRERSARIRRVSEGPLRRIRLPRESALYGRGHELDVLRARWGDVLRGDGQVVLVLGEAGVGKTRLVDELASRLAAQGTELTYLFGASTPGGAAPSRGAFSTAYREHFGVAGLEDALRPYLRGTPSLVAPFAAILRGDAPPLGRDAIQPESLAYAFVHVARELARRRPTVFLVDDIHFAPEATRALFAALAAVVPGHRILLVGTAGPELSSSWIAQMQRLHAVHTLSLTGLRPDDVRAILEELLSESPVAGELAPRVSTLSDGNPFFVFEIVRSMQEAGLLVREAGDVWTLRGRAEDVELPRLLHDLIQARIARLTREESEILGVAAVQGFRFDPLLVAEVLRRPRIPVLTSLGRLERVHRLVRSWGRRYSFEHRQVQEALYEALPPPVRTEHHAAIGAALERRLRAPAPGVGSGNDAVEACRHYLRANRGGAALRHLDRAIEHLEGGYLDDAAAELTGEVLRVPGLLEGERRTALLLRHANQLALLGRRREQAQVLEEAVRGADRRKSPSLAARARTRLGEYLQVAGHPARAHAYFERALEIARPEGDLRLEAEALRGLAVVCGSQGLHEDARGHALRHLEVARGIGEPGSEADARGSLATTLLHGGDMEAALEEFRRSLTLFEEAEDVRQQGHAAGSVGLCLTRLGRPDEARAIMERSLAASRRLGYRRGEASALGNLGAISLCQGRLTEARDYIDRDLALQQEGGTPLDRSRALLSSGALELALGRIASSRRLLEDSLARFRTLGDASGTASALWQLAKVANEEGKSDEAQQHLEEALRRFEEVQTPHETSALHADLGRLHLYEGRSDEARSHLEAALKSVPPRGADETAILATCALAVLDPEHAARARRLLEPGGACVPPAARTEAFYLLWRATGSARHLEAAHELLRERVQLVPRDARTTFLRQCAVHRRILEARRT